MTPLGKIATASAVVLTFCATTSALAGSPSRSVHLDCAPNAASTVAPNITLCAALGEAIRAAHGVDLLKDDRGGSAKLTVRFEPTRTGAQSLAGYLTWQDTTGQTGRGPEIELTVIDTAMQPEMLAEFARQLVASSSLPL